MQGAPGGTAVRGPNVGRRPRTLRPDARTGAEAIEVRRAGLEPLRDRLDGSQADVFDMTLGLAREHGLALRVHDPSRARALPAAGPTGRRPRRARQLPTRPRREASLLRAAPARATGRAQRWAVHPSLGDDGSRALEPATWRVRKTDLDFLVSAEARDVLDQEGIVLLDFRALQKVWSRFACNSASAKPLG